VARDAQETRRRIFEAATAEFAAHGIAGARIDRIAAGARANKQLIYVYFGNKRRLFETVISDHVARFVESVPFDAERLPDYAAAAFDHFASNPEVTQLGQWHSLEPGESAHRIPVIEKAIRARTKLIAGAQATGRVDPTIPPEELLALVTTLASTWAVGTPERNPQAGVGARVTARRRAAVVEAVTRLVAPPADERSALPQARTRRPA
jgi:AcrR family transcriptional regulator